MTTAVRVKFTNSYQSGIGYDFLTNLELKSGDLVVVDTSNGYAAAEVTAVGINSTRAVKWVVSKVDLQAHIDRVENDKKLSDVKKKMETLRKKLQDTEVYALLAQTNEDMAALLNQYDALKKGE